MRGIGRFIAIIFAIVVIAIVAVVIFRKPIAGYFIRAELTSYGLVSPVVNISEFSLHRIAIARLSADTANGEPAINVTELAITFDVTELIAERRLRELTVQSVSAVAELSGDGSLSFAGIDLGGGASGASDNPSRDWLSKDPPFNQITVEGATIELKTPEGEGVATLTGVLNGDWSGEVDIDIDLPKAGLGGMSVENGVGNVEISLDGVLDELKADASIEGDLHSTYGMVRDIDVELKTMGAKWRSLLQNDLGEFAANAEIDIKGVEVFPAPGVNPAIDQGLSMFAGGEEVGVQATGALKVSVRDGIIEVSHEGLRLALAAPDKVSLVVSGKDDEPLWRFQEGEHEFALAVELKALGQAAAAAIDLRHSAAGWTFDIPIDVSSFFGDAWSVSGFKVAIIGALHEKIMSFSATISGDMEMRPAEGVAGMLKDASLKIDSDIHLQGDLYANFTGDMSGRAMRYIRDGASLSGAPPEISFTGALTPVTQSAMVKTSISGGDIVLNDAFRFDQFFAEPEISLKEGQISATARDASLRLRQTGAAPVIAPLLVSADMELTDGAAEFDYVSKTAGGAILANGSGKHDIQTGAGRAEFAIAEVVFSSDGLQPKAIAPVLTGIVDDVTGSVSGKGVVNWGASGLTSNADFSISNLSFRGPGVTVAETKGVHGDIALSSLWPVATKGEQTISIGGIDMGALALPQGEVNFTLPGDDTLQIEEALFPWFDGEIGVRSARAAFSGGNAEVPLVVRSIDLSKLLDFANVDGLSGEGRLSGALPLVIKEARASFVGGALTSDASGRISYIGNAGAAASAGSEDSKLAFDLLRDLQFKTMSVLIDGPLDGRLDFRVKFEGDSDIEYNGETARVPVNYTVTLDAALLELLEQANVTRDFQRQYQRVLDEALP